MTWHVIRTKPKQEQRAIENLQKQDFECFLPTCSIEKIRRGRITVSLEPLFPRYLFINLKQGTNWAPIRSALGVQNLVKFGTEAAKVPDDLIETLRAIEDHIQSNEPERLFSKGDKVQIISGPFAGLEGVYQMTDGETRAMVLIELLIPFALQISVVSKEVPGCSVDFCSCKIDIHAIHGACKGFASMELA